MVEVRRYSSKENQEYWENHLKEVGPGKTLSYLTKANEDEKIELAKADFERPEFGGLPLCVTLHIAAGRDAKELLSRYSQKPFEAAILELHSVILAAAIGEAALRFYLRHLLIEFFGWCDELDGMIDILIEMYKRRREMPIDSSSEYLESWWEDFAHMGNQIDTVEKQ